MEITIDIPEKKVEFVMELLRNLDFLTVKSQRPSQPGFTEAWANFSAHLPQEDADISEDDIQAEIRAVRVGRK